MKTPQDRFSFLAFAFAAALSAATPAGAAGRPDLVQSGVAAGRAHVPQEMLVQFKPGVTFEQKTRALNRVEATSAEIIVDGRARADAHKGDLELLRFAPGRGMIAALRQLATDDSVEFAEPNWIYFHQAAADDTYYVNGSLWGMYGDASNPANTFGSQAAEAWAQGNTCNAGVYVGVIDEGFMTTHADLAPNVFANPFDPVDGIDNDGNGFVDDVNGWDFAGNDNSVYDGTSDDHGTHVAGTIGAVGGNGTGVAGMCWSVRLISAKFLGRNGGTTANAIKAVDYLTNLKTRHGLNIVATNNSWGGGGYSQGLYDAIARANTANILFVAAAGNGGRDGVGDDNDTAPSYPASYSAPNVIAVASITSLGTRSSFSNFGATSVHLGAPGSAIYSTLPGKRGGSAYGAYSGTSMAAPHVTGAAAMYASRNPGASAAQIKNEILNATIATPSLAGKTVTGGRLDVSGF